MLFIYIVAVIAWALIWGFATRTVIYNKGYSDNWFWWGFFFGFIAFIVALSKGVLAPGENRHSGPGENRQFWPGENRQSLFTI